MQEPMRFEIRELHDYDRDWVCHVLQVLWGATLIVSRGHVHHADQLPGFLAVGAGVPLGLLTFHIAGDQCEVVTLNALVERQGIGTALLQAVQHAARAAHCRRLWLITTNDNVPAITFYQRRGLTVAAIHYGAVDVARRLKPTIPQIGRGGVPVHDEIELALHLESSHG
jgi:ribosomal protein S18 acetylase RimI-like enzyme